MLDVVVVGEIEGGKRNNKRNGEERETKRGRKIGGSENEIRIEALTTKGLAC